MKRRYGQTIGLINAENSEGTVRVIGGMKDIEKIKPHEIIVLRKMSPYTAPYIIKCNGIVVEEAALLQHASILAREFGIPCISLKNAMKILKNGDKVVLDSHRGEVIVID